MKPPGRFNLRISPTSLAGALDDKTIRACYAPPLKSAQNSNKNNSMSITTRAAKYSTKVHYNYFTSRLFITRAKEKSTSIYFTQIDSSRRRKHSKLGGAQCVSRNAPRGCTRGGSALHPRPPKAVGIAPACAARLCPLPYPEPSKAQACHHRPSG